jgi:hypothetical protein
MKYIKILSLLFLILLSISCRKDKVSKNETIHGSVINLYTNAPVAGLKVELKTVLDRTGGYLNIRKGKYSETLTETTTDSNGNFSFTGIEIHSNPDYFYRLLTNSGHASQTSGAPYNDAVKDIDKGNLDANMVLDVKPTISSLNIQMVPATNIVYPDTITIKCQPKHLIGPYSNITFTSIMLKSGNPITILQYDPMGWWYININKTKNSVNTMTKDSIYLDFASTTTYTLSF